MFFYLIYYKCVSNILKFVVYSIWLLIEDCFLCLWYCLVFGVIWILGVFWDDGLLLVFLVNGNCWFFCCLNLVLIFNFRFWEFKMDGNGLDIFLEEDYNLFDIVIVKYRDIIIVKLLFVMILLCEMEIISSNYGV